MAASIILKILKPHLLRNPKSDWAQTWWMALGPYEGIELLKSFHSDIQDGRHVGHLGNLQMASPPKPYVRLCWNLMGGIGATQRFRMAKVIPFRYLRWPPLLKIFKPRLLPNGVRLSLNLVGGIGVTWRFRIAKFFPFQYPRWPPWWPSWKSWNDICFQTVSRIELKLCGRHFWDMEIQNFQTILLRYPRWPPQQPSWSSSIVSLCCSLLTMVCPSSVCPLATFHILDISIRIIYMMPTMTAILKVLNCYLLPNLKSDGAETWLKAFGQHGDLELLKWFRSDIQDGHHGSHRENLQITSAAECLVWLSLNLMGGIRVLWKFRIAKTVLFQYPRCAPSWNSSNHISAQTISQIEP